MSRVKIHKPNGDCYVELWVEGSTLQIQLSAAPDFIVHMDKKAIPSLIIALQQLQDDEEKIENE